ncbi:MAG: glycosyltransferase [Verrucomicrobiales bacterium]|nr:glycosyltransferase [Verrucomicrobiales bacterium]
MAAFRVLGFLIARRFQDKRWGDGTKDQQPAAVIIPVKGFDYQATPRFFDTLFAQEYSNYRVIVCFESWDDPVAVWLKEELELTEGHPFWIHPDEDSGLKSITLACSGISQDEGQKVHNQRAAFEHLDENDEVVVFADADISFKTDWLPRLIAPINQKTHPLATTYRWLVPKRPTLPNQVASVINGSITTQGGSELTNVLWGGSMAIARSVFDKLDVSSLLEGSLNDDLRLSKAARKAGNKIAFVRSLVLPTMIDFNWKTFFEFAKRQYTQVKFFSPILYTGTNFVLGFYAIGLLSIIGALVYGYFYAWIPIAAAYVIDQFRALMRQQIYLSLFPEDGVRRKLFSAGWLEHMLTPFWMLLHWLLLISTWTQSKITWAGTQYRILSKSKTRILSRTVVAERLPVGVPGLTLVSALHDRKRTGYTQPIQPLLPPVKTEAVADPVEDLAAEKVEAVDIVHEEPSLPDTGTAEPDETSEGGTGDFEPAKRQEPTPALTHPGVNPHVLALSAPPPSLRRKRKARAQAKRKKNARTTPSMRSKSQARSRLLHAPFFLAKPGQSLRWGSALKTKNTDEESNENAIDASSEATLTETPEPKEPAPALSHPGVNPHVLALSAPPHSPCRKRKARTPAKKKRNATIPSYLSKTRAHPHVLFSPLPLAKPGQSLPPGSALKTKDTGEESRSMALGRSSDTTPPESPVPSPEPTLPASSALFSTSHAARRAIGKANPSHPGSGSRRSALSSRANQISNLRGHRILRPVSHRPSGRPL